MNRTPEPRAFRAAEFRARLLAAMMIVVVSVAGIALYFAERELVRGVEADLEAAFTADIANWQSVQQIRQAALLERVRILASKPRLHSALEPSDNAIDLLYQVANDEMHDVMETPAEPRDPGAPGLHAEFYRFLDREGRVIPIPEGEILMYGNLSREEEARLALPEVPRDQQIGYIIRPGSGGMDALVEIIAMPIISRESEEVIGTLVVGFETLPLVPRPGSGILRGLWLDGAGIHAPALAAGTRAAMSSEVTLRIATGRFDGSSFRSEFGGSPYLLFHKRVNPDSLYPAAHEVSVYPLAGLVQQQRRLRWQVAGAGALLLLGAFGASHFISGRLAGPVVKLADASAEDRAQLHRAEAALELSHEELQRAARFSADASHQLRTPVAVLRAGLEEILHRETLTTKETEELSALVHQTYRLSGIIEDLLLLSRIDAGRLKLDMAPVDLNELVEAALDDVGASPGARGVAVESDLPPGLRVLGERRYIALVLQNLMENAWKYNRPDGRIRVEAAPSGEWIDVRVSNTGIPIPAQARDRIFERFHRSGMGENVPGYGLGLNIALELARLHGGHLRLVRSDEEGTEFELRLRRAEG